MADLADFKARLPILPIVRRHVRLQRAGPLWRGLCPFHQEKTPSFTVTEARGTYHCFGCGAHGNGIDFVMALEGLDFPEAVERAAELTGLEPPARAKPDPERAKALALTDVLEEAARWYRQRLADSEGAAARGYLHGRGVEPATVARFELGLAPDGRDRLTRTLEAKGVPLDDLVASGLSIRPDDGGAAFDRFRDRLMFPIRDRRGRLVGFGGRALSDGAKAKYLNSPEGPLFRKRELLYGADKLDRSAGRGRLHVVEGYMDVIALAEAGLPAVAPLGTAVTPEQIKLLWRLADVPLVCLDGDQAGQRAAGRLAEAAFAELEAGRSLAFALLPEGEDPDSLLRRQGRAGFARAVEQNTGLGAMLLRHLGGETSGRGPEARAELRKRLREIVRAIPDADVRVEYEREFAAWLGDSRGDRGFQRARTGDLPARTGAGRGPGAGRVRTVRVDDVRRQQELMVIYTLLREPGLIEAAAAYLERTEFHDPRCQVLGDRFVDLLLGGEVVSEATLPAALTTPTLCAARDEIVDAGRRLERGFPVRATAFRLLGFATPEDGEAPGVSLAAAEAARARAAGSPAAAAYEAIERIRQARDEG